MMMLILLLSVVIVLNSCKAEASDLEKFFTSGFNKETTDDNQAKGNNAGTTVNDLVQFMRRAGLLATRPPNSNQQNTLQTQSSQQPSIYFLPQQSQLTNYAAPQRQQQQLQQQQQQLQQQQQQPQLQQQQPLALSSNTASTNTVSKTPNLASSALKQDISAKKVDKADRQGLYAQDGLYDNGYSGNHGGYVSSGGSYADSHGDAYSAGHYAAPEPLYHKQAYSPPSVAIKIDPIAILKLLLQGIPKPLLNLNGKVFFGVELGKNAGIVKGVGHVPHKHHGGGGYAAQPHGGGTILTLG